ncbi:hypothetical protein AC1031_009602 [Aphanomyces cochlioides]|nr:hypothetical protein AC1031_009602 [Aphanomyces cochlioides]
MCAMNMAAIPMLRRSPATSTTNQRRFTALFGVSISVATLTWEKMPRPEGAQPWHLLWALMILKIYSSENVHATIAGADEKTFRKWCWLILDSLEELDAVSR